MYIKAKCKKKLKNNNRDTISKHMSNS